MKNWFLFIAIIAEVIKTSALKVVRGFTADSIYCCCTRLYDCILLFISHIENNSAGIAYAVWLVLELF